MSNSAITQQVQGLATTTSPGLVGTGAQSFAGVKTFQDGLVPPSSMMFRNKLINGGFDIWQRGTSQTGTGYGSDDRWSNANSGSTKTASRQTFTLGQTDVPGNPRYWSRTVVSSVAGASNFCIKAQKVENVITLAGQTATLSFWAKADASKNMAVEMEQFFGTGGSPSSGVTSINVTTCALTSSWQRFTITVSIPSVTGKTLGTNNDDFLAVNFWFDAGSSFNARTNSLGQQSGTFDIANVQLEAGTAATPFESRPIGAELALCQRYAYVASDGDGIGGQAPTATEVQVRFKFPMTMRTIPAASLATSGSWVITTDLIDITATTVIAGVITGSSGNQARVRLGGFSGLTIGTTTYWSGGGAAGTARLLFSSEL